MHGEKTGKAAHCLPEKKPPRRENVSQIAPQSILKDSREGGIGERKEGGRGEVFKGVKEL